MGGVLRNDTMAGSPSLKNRQNLDVPKGDLPFFMGGTMTQQELFKNALWVQSSEDCVSYSVAQSG